MNSKVNRKVNSKTLIEMAREAGFEFNRLGCTYTSGYLEDYLDRFAALVRADEREACANICETLELPEWPDKIRQPLAQAIRARVDA